MEDVIRRSDVSELAREPEQARRVYHIHRDHQDHERDAHDVCAALLIRPPGESQKRVSAVLSGKKRQEQNNEPERRTSEVKIPQRFLASPAPAQPAQRDHPREV